MRLYQNLVKKLKIVYLTNDPANADYKAGEINFGKTRIDDITDGGGKKGILLLIKQANSKNGSKYPFIR